MGTVLAGAATDTGRVREQNEDVVRITAPDSAEAGTDRVLAAVADGMGGYQGGEVASRIAVDALFAAFADDTFEGGVAAALRRGFKAANDRIIAESAGTDPDSAMGTTLVAAAIVGDQLTVANIGDSRAYLLRAEAATQITRDHSLIAEQVAAGVISPEEARASRYRNVVTRALGQRPKIDVDIFEISLLPEDRVVLCSDGVHGSVEPESIATLGLRAAPQAASRELLDLALERGSTDNVSAVVLWYEPAAAAVGAPVPDRAMAGVGGGGLSPALVLLLLVALIALIGAVAYFAFLG